jgi:hypothetical protein
VHHACGERNGRARLTAEEALEVYHLARSRRYSQREIADGYGISQSEVSLIHNRARWRWLLEGKENSMPKVEIEQVELDELKARLAKLEKAAAPPAPIKSEPYQPIYYTSGASMDAETKRDLAKAIPDDLARDLHADLARGNPITASPSQLTPDRGGGERVEIRRGTGWQEERKLETPPGIALADRLMDMQDAIDRADLQRRLGGVKKE